VFFAAVTAAQPGPDFTVSVNPASLTIPPGGSDSSSTTTVASTGGFSSAVTLACSGQPTGIGCSFAPPSVTPPPDGSATSVLTVTVDLSVAPGTYSFDVTGTSGASTKMAPITVQVGSFTLTCSPSNFNVSSGFTKTSKCTVHSVNFSSPVSFSCANQPPGVSCGADSVTPPPDGTAVTTLIVTGSSVPTGDYSFQAMGASGAQKASDTISLRVRP